MADDSMRRRRDKAARAFADRRAELSLTQEQVARRADIVVKSVYNFEVQGRWPNARTRARLEKAVGWPAGEIERQAGDGSGRAPEVDPSLLARLRQLDSAERERLIEWLQDRPPREANGGRAAGER